MLLRRHGRLSAPQLAELLQLSSVGLCGATRPAGAGRLASVTEKPKRGGRPPSTG